MNPRGSQLSSEFCESASTPCGGKSVNDASFLDELRPFPTPIWRIPLISMREFCEAYEAWDPAEDWGVKIGDLSAVSAGDEKDMARLISRASVVLDESCCCS